jgi:hypothetical protein
MWGHMGVYRYYECPDVTFRIEDTVGISLAGNKVIKISPSSEMTDDSDVQYKKPIDVIRKPNKAYKLSHVCERPYDVLRGKMIRRLSGHDYGHLSASDITVVFAALCTTYWKN